MGKMRGEAETRNQVTSVEKIIFTGKQNIPWNEVEQYLKKYIGACFVVEKYKDEIWIAGDFPDENKDMKHRKNASEGWYRYDTYFSVPVKGSNDEMARENLYLATLVARKTEKGLYLYDIVDIKKEASTPLESK